MNLDKVQTSVRLDISGPGFSDSYTVAPDMTADSPAEAAEELAAMIDFVAGKGKRALGFNTAEQTEEEQLQHLVNTISEHGGSVQVGNVKMTQCDTYGNPTNECEDARVLADFEVVQALENLAATLEESGMTDGKFTRRAVAQIVDAELTRILNGDQTGGPEETGEPDQETDAGIEGTTPTEARG